MNLNRKKLTIVSLILVLLFSLTGCSLLGNGKQTYASYVKSLLDVNYKADYTEYMKITGATEEEAKKVYDDGITYLAEALMTAYGINDVEGSDIKDQFSQLAKDIYSHASYEVTEVTKTDGVYQVTVTIYPIDILTTTYDDVVAYIENMNNRVTAGDYNDYELDEYETEYAQGILDILTAAVPNIGNGEGVPVTVTIQDNDEYYYISDADFLALDKAILATPVVNEDGITDSTDSSENNGEGASDSTDSTDAADSSDTTEQ